jgi:hypothetical protein
MSLIFADALTFVQNLAPTWVKPQQVVLAQLMCAMAERPSLCPTELARALPDGPHAQGPQSLHGRHKRLDRFLSNPRLDEPAIFWRCYRLGVRYGSEVPQAAMLLPILLDTTYFEPFAALVASIPCGGRALPIAFTTYHRRHLTACFPPVARWPDPETVAIPPARRQHAPLEAASAEVQGWTSQNHIEEQLLHYLWSFVTSDQPVVVADRGFARASLFRWFLGLQRHFVIRFDADTWLHLPTGEAGAVAALLPLRPGEQVWLPHAHYGKEDRVPVAVLAVWDRGQAEPWYLATTLTDPTSVETCYRWRMRIEAGNRDQKTGVILREGGDAHRLTSVLHLHRLLLVNLCLLWLLALVGLQAQRDLGQPGASPSALEQVAPNDPDLDLLDHGPAQPPPVQPHGGPPTARPPWLRRFALRGPLSYVRLGLEVVRQADLSSIVRRAVRWLGLYLWHLTPLWSTRQQRYRIKTWWPLPT